MKYMKGQVQPNMPNLAERTEAIQLSVPRSLNSFDLVKLISQEKPLTCFIHPLERLSIEQLIIGKILPSRANGISFKPLTA